MRQVNEKKEQKRRRPDNIRSFRAPADGKLLEVMTALLADHSATKVKSMLRHHQFAVNGMPTSQFDFEISAGDLLEVNFDQSFRVFKHPRIKLVFEDEHVLVIEKGYGMLSMGTDRIKEGTAYSVMREYVKYHNPNARLFIVHRLDRDTSGLMMMAKSIEAKEAMQHNWNNMVLNRNYVAVVEGEMENDEGVQRSYLAETSKFEVYSTDDPKKGQLAVTRYRTLRRGHGYSLMELSLDTGRKNQIRVHMKDLGHPIAGDRKYGAKSSPIHRLALHARTLQFVHPISRKLMTFESPIPARFRSLLG